MCAELFLIGWLPLMLSYRSSGEIWLENKLLSILWGIATFCTTCYKSRFCKMLRLSSFGLSAPIVAVFTVVNRLPVSWPDW
jgi:hypothetical protein